MRAIIILIMLLTTAMAFAQNAPTPNEIERRARDVGRSLRCVVCQNQSIEDSDAALAKDMRALVRERIAIGATDAEVIDFMRLRYGDYVLLKPPLQRNTYLLWFAPGLILLGMGGWLLLITRKRKTDIENPSPLTEEERTVLNRFMDDNT